MPKKRKPKKPAARAIPPLSLEVLEEVETIEEYAKRQLERCSAPLGALNVEKAKRIARTCAVSVLDATLIYYESLATFDERWVRELRENVINAVVGMIPAGYSDELYDEFYEVLAHTTYDHLNPPKSKKKPQPVSQPKPQLESIADQINRLRNECHLTTEELAEQIGVDARTARRHLGNKSNPYPRHITAYERVFSKLLNRQVVIRQLS